MEANLKADPSSQIATVSDISQEPSTTQEKSTSSYREKEVLTKCLENHQR